MTQADAATPGGTRPWERFRGRAEAYARWRPGYPPQALDAILEGLPSPAPRAPRAADVGAGTGISARALADRGVDVTAVEPNAEMRAQATPHPRVRWVEGTAERTGLEAHGQDLVLCAQAFHWFEARAALAEFRRVLRPGGRLALLWNARLQGHPLVDAYSALVESVALPGPPRGEPGSLEDLLRGAGWLGVERLRFDGGQRLDLQGLVGRATSTSYAPREGPAHARLLAGLTALHAAHAGPDGVLFLPYAVTLWRAASPGASPSAAP